MSTENAYEQIAEISNLLLEYSAGNYGYQGKISDEVNELDMIISGINMLGEELLSTNVSKDYFVSIFNAVTDLVLIVDDNGHLQDINMAAGKALGIDSEDLEGKKLNDYVNQDIFKKIKTRLKQKKSEFLVIEEILNGAGKKIIYGLFTCSQIIDRYGVFKGYLISIKDITEQKEKETLILKTIFTTQQQEQKRVADDLHDSIGQELSMTKLMISNLRALCKDDPKQMELINTSTEVLDNSIKALREICFNLMPNVLSKGGLEPAIEDLISKLEMSQEMEVIFKKNTAIPKLEADLEVAIYRIIQEFINNMIKHARASKFEIAVLTKKKERLIRINLQDNGVGFDIKKLSKIGENRGLQNLQSKAKAFNGSLEIWSAPGEGTIAKIAFPYNHKTTH